MCRRLLFFAAAALTAAACVSSTEAEIDDVLLLPDRSVYVHGDTMEVQLINNSDESVGYGACSQSLQRRERGEWRSVSPDIGICIAILYVLQPGGRRASRQPIDSALPVGVYRLRQVIMPGTTLPEHAIFSPPVTIRAPA